MPVTANYVVNMYKCKLFLDGYDFIIRIFINNVYKW